MSRLFRGGLIGGLVVLCAAHSVAAAPQAPPDTARAPASGRLGRDVVPVAEAVALTLDPSRPDYAGRVTIRLTARRSAALFRLHARDLTITRLTLRSAAAAVPARWSRDGEIVTVTPAHALAPGAYTLAIAFTNHFNTQATSLYRIETGGHAYAFTQFEAVDARGAFPCWDEPEFKIPWDIALTVPRGSLAIANTPVARTTAAAGGTTVTFRRTPPLPSYLVALAVGPFETVPVPGVSVPTRIVTVQGQAALAAEAVRLTPPIVAALERYFGRRYPFEKLDMIAVPEFWAGAMENAGAITFADRILLIDPHAVTARERYRLASTMSHEIAHMWFGDLVTMAWWDDLWLNESFASWMSDKVLDEAFPELHAGLRHVSDTEQAMQVDARPSVRAVRQPVAAVENLDQLADALAYDKGEAVLGMFEHWIGAETFRRGVLAYLADHAGGSATGADLWNALSKASGRDVAGAMTTFLDQPGVPLVTVRSDGTGLHLSQRRFFARPGADDAHALWRIPVTLRIGRADGVLERSLLLETPETTIPVDAPVLWVEPNGHAAGYYRWASDATPRLLDRTAGTLDTAERVDLVGDESALLDAGLVHGDEYLAVLERLAGDPAPEVVEQALGGLGKVKQAFVTPETREAFAGYVRRTVAPALDRIGRVPAPHEDDAVTVLRPQLLEWMGAEGHDRATLDFADSLARVLAVRPEAVDPSLADVAVQLSSVRGDSTLFEAYRARFEAARIPAERVRYLSALGHFRSPALVERALAYALTGPLRPQEITTIPRALGRDPELDDRLWIWMTSNYDAIMARIPPTYGTFLAYYASGCTGERLEKARAFFSDPAHSPPGIDKELAKVADQVTDCAALRAREGGAIEARLRAVTGSDARDGAAGGADRGRLGGGN